MGEERRSVHVASWEEHAAPLEGRDGRPPEGAGTSLNSIAARVAGLAKVGNVAKTSSTIITGASRAQAMLAWRAAASNSTMFAAAVRPGRNPRW